MKKKFVNSFHLEGCVYESELELKVTGQNSKNPGTTYISGNLSIATDDECLNVIPVHYSYVTATTAKGGVNSTFTTLKAIIDGELGTVMRDGKENATLVRVDTSVALNEFYTDRNGETELVSAKRAEGGFIHKADSVDTDEKKRNRFDTDMIITQVRRIEANEERGTNEKVVIKGAIFDFRGAMLPVEYSVTNPAAMDYFESAGVSSREPMFTKVWGKQVSEIIVRKITEESAFGDDSVQEVKYYRKDWVITGASKIPYEWGLDETITDEEFKKAIEDRNTYLATLKSRQEEWKSQRNAATSTTSSTSNGGFNF